MESHKMEETGLDAEKSQSMLVNLRDHLVLAFPNLLTQTMPLSLIRNDTEGNISLVVPLKSRAEPTVSSARGYVNMGLPLDTPTFMLQFIPMAMVTITDDQESPSPSSQSLINVTVATYHGLILRKDRLRFYITYNNPNDLQEVELKISSCELLEKLENFTQGFRLCAGFEVFNGLDLNSVFIEPFGNEFVIARSRKCEYLLELEDLFSLDKIDLNRVSCVQCGLIQNSALFIKSETPQQQSSRMMHEFHIDDESDHQDDIEEDDIYFNKVNNNILLDCNSKKEKIYLSVDYNLLKYKRYVLAFKFILFIITDDNFGHLTHASF